jgi:uncharacterized membrane protein YbhN (UPF0104 family)
VAVAGSRGEAKEFIQRARSIRPMWLIGAAILQAGTYAYDAQLWRFVVRRCRCVLPFGSLFRLRVARLFVAQVVPSGGVGGDVVVVRALEKEGIPLDALMTALNHHAKTDIDAAMWTLVPSWASL